MVRARNAPTQCDNCEKIFKNNVNPGLHKKHLGKHIQKVREYECFRHVSDVTLVCDDSGQFEAQKVILAASSPLKKMAQLMFFQRGLSSTACGAGVREREAKPGQIEDSAKSKDVKNG